MVFPRLLHTIIHTLQGCQYARDKKMNFFIAGRSLRPLETLSPLRRAGRAGMGGMNPRAFRLDSKPFPVRTPGSRQDGALPHTPLSCTCMRDASGAPWQSLHPAPSWQSLHAATFQGSGNHCFRGVSRRAMATPAPRASRRGRAHAPGEERREQGRVPPSAAD